MTRPPRPSPAGPVRPTPAEQARTTVACARVGCLTTYARHAPARPHLTSVALGPDDDGRPVVHVTPGSLAAAQLLARPLATLQVAPAGREVATVHGAAQRLRATGDGLLRFRLDVGAVRLGRPHPVAVPVEDYRAAEPDPLRGEAPAVLAHLAQCHAEQLAACLRARGHDTAWAEPQALDRGGLDVLSVGPQGVERVRLAFPAPVARLKDLAAGLAVPLLCRCAGREAQGASGG